MLLLGQMALLGEGPPLTRQLIQVDHLGLVSLEQAPISPLQPLQAGPQPDAGRVVGASTVRLCEKAFELRHELCGVAEQSRDVRPDRLLERLGLDAGPRALRLAGRRERVGPGAAIVAPGSLSGVPPSHPVGGQKPINLSAMRRVAACRWPRSTAANQVQWSLTRQVGRLRADPSRCSGASKALPQRALMP